jgi:hypothetical protein
MKTKYNELDFSDKEKEEVLIRKGYTIVEETFNEWYQYRVRSRDDDGVNTSNLG